MWLQLLSNGNSVPCADHLIHNLNGICITEIIPVGTDVALQWRGGVGPYQVQRRESLDDDGSWANEGDTTTLTNAMATIEDDTGFFRITQP
jgi:hypothetical protein